MVNLKLIGKKGSKSAKIIRRETGIGIYKGNKKGMVDALINYGLAGTNYDAFMKKWPSAKSLPIINKKIGYSKFYACGRMAEKDIPVPESKHTLSGSDNVDDWIEKRTNSIGGIGICKAKGRGSISGKYYQKYIENRKYELRVHAFSWIPEEEWRIQKRVGDPNEIAWNYKNGGHFITVNNPRSFNTFKDATKISEQVLGILGMSFGAVDLLVDSNYNLYFIEINSAPGFSELSQPIYVDAFSRLKKVSKTDLTRIAS